MTARAGIHLGAVGATGGQQTGGDDGGEVGVIDSDGDHQGVDRLVVWSGALGVSDLVDLGEPRAVIGIGLIGGLGSEEAGVDPGAGAGEIEEGRGDAAEVVDAVRGEAAAVVVRAMAGSTGPDGSREPEGVGVSFP